MIIDNYKFVLDNQKKYILTFWQVESQSPKALE